MGVTLVVHGHFYQPPRENPWTEEVEREPSAAPYHDWNERITDECYRPNAVARIVDERGRVLGIVDNYAHLSFNVGPTLFSWLDEHAADVAAAISADAQGAIAQAYSHLILPLADERDVRTQVRWGLADFRHRFGRAATAMWLPECAVDEAVLAVLAEEGIGATILAPGQIAAVRPLDGSDDDDWLEVASATDTSRPLRWLHPTRPDLGVDLVVYDGALSHDIAFGLDKLSSAAIVERASRVGSGLAVIATDGETFGHHHRWGERAIAYALTVEAPRRDITVVTTDAAREAFPPTHEARVRTSAWSCAHGVERWRSDCGCSTGGEPGWNQAWRTPLRAALDIVREALTEVFERRGKSVFHDPWAARDAYIDVMLNEGALYAFLAEHVVGDREEALVLMEAQRHAMAMYTSCGWFFNDLAGIETIQVLRYAARVLDLLDALEDGPGAAPVLAVLAEARSNDAEEGTGLDIWRRHVEPARVTPSRVAAHLALTGALAAVGPPARIAAWDVIVVEAARAERGALALATGIVELTHRRTGVTTAHAYGALRLGGLEVVGAVLAASSDAAAAPRATAAVATLQAAFRDGMPVTGLLVLLGEQLGADGFGLEAALPGRVEELLGDVSESLTARFGAQLDHLLDDARPTLDALAAAGFPLPPELERTAEVALARRIEAMVAAQRGSMRLRDYSDALALARSPLASHLEIDSPRARRLLGELLADAATRAADGEGADAAEGAAFAVGVLRLAADLGVRVDIDRAQEHVYAAVRGGERPDLAALAAELHLAIPAT
jgi:hypothetical protein